jgi:hypothetical protein
LLIYKDCTVLSNTTAESNSVSNLWWCCPHSECCGCLRCYMME